MPDGYAAHVAGGTPLQDGTAGFTTWHGETITVWLDFVLPPDSLSSPEGPDDGSHGSPTSSHEGSSTSAAAPDKDGPVPPTSQPHDISRADRSRSPRDSRCEGRGPCAAEDTAGHAFSLQPISTPCRAVTTRLPALDGPAVDSAQDGHLLGPSTDGGTDLSSHSSIFTCATDVMTLVSEANTDLARPVTELDSVQGSARDDWMSATFRELHCLASDATHRVTTASPTATNGVDHSSTGSCALCLAELLPLDPFQQSVPWLTSSSKEVLSSTGRTGLTLIFVPSPHLLISLTRSSFVCEMCALGGS